VTLKLHAIQIVLIAVLIFAVFFAGHETAITNNCPQPIINNYIDVNVITPPITFDKNMFEQPDKNYSPVIVVNVEQKPTTQAPASESTTYVTNNYITDANIPLVYYPFHMQAIDLNGNTVFDDANNFADGTQALTAMQKMTSVEYTQFVYGAMIISINGVSVNEASHEYWALYEDGNYSAVGISDIVINKPTDILWKVETW